MRLSADTHSRLAEVVADELHADLRNGADPATIANTFFMHNKAGRRSSTPGAAPPPFFFLFLSATAETINTEGGSND